MNSRAQGSNSTLAVRSGIPGKEDVRKVVYRAGAISAPPGQDSARGFMAR